MQSWAQLVRLRKHLEVKVAAERIAFNTSDKSSGLPIGDDGSALNESCDNLESAKGTTGSSEGDSQLSSPTDGRKQGHRSLEHTFTNHLVRETTGVSIVNHDDKGIPEAFIVRCGSSEDNTDPRSWPRSTRLGATIIIWTMVFACGYASASSSSARSKASTAFGVSGETDSLATALFLFGNGIGALGAGPLSETTGRNPAYLISMALYMICILITAVAPNIVVQLVFRFFAGLFASPTLTIYGGSLADMYSDTERSLVWPLFATSPLLGPILAPVPSGWIANASYLSFRWIDWVTLIISGFAFLLAAAFLKETFSPMLLTWKASILREYTSDVRFQSSHELADSLMSRLWTNVKRPFVFFTREPIVIALGSYLTLIYVLVFTFLDGFVFIFEDTYGFNSGQKGSVFASIAIGVLINMATQPLFARHYRQRLRHHQSVSSDENASLAPEIRLWPAIIASPLLPISLFWLGWTNFANVSVWNGIIAAGLFGFSLFGIFVSSYQYIMDSYETQSASALASITFMRYMVAGGMVIADTPMFDGLGVHWTLTLLGCLGVVLMPLPAVFYRYGNKIREKSHFAKKLGDSDS